MKDYFVKEETWKRSDGSYFVIRRIVANDGKVIGSCKIEVDLFNAVKEIAGGK